MVTDVVNMIVLGVLVALFASIYRLQSTIRLRFWIVGWLFILFHFALLLWHPVSAAGQNLAIGLSISLIMLCGISFILSAMLPRLGSRWREIAAVMIVPPLSYGWMACWGVKPALAYACVNILGHGIGFLLLWTVYRDREGAAVIGTAILFSGMVAIFYQISLGRPGVGVGMILAELFALHALFFWAEGRRLTAGTVTSGLGLLAWAAVFPLALAIAAYRPHWAVDAEIWNVPKFFVAFGMIVILLEDEIALAGRQRAQYQLLFEQNPLPMWIFDRSSERILEVNARAVSEYGYERERFLTMKMGELLGAGEGLAPGELDWLTVEESRQQCGPWQLRKSDGTETMVETSARAVRFEGQEAGLILANDVTERVKLYEQLIHQANHDPLTGLPNRLLLADRMETALASAERHGAKAAILCLDLDRFKQINDSIGHAAGDSCLKEIAIRLKGRLRTVDTAARTGGEEFMVILDGIQSDADVEKVALDLLYALSVPHTVDEREIELSVSIGVALYPDDGQDSDALWRLSDTAMYRAKEAGGNRYCFYSREADRLCQTRDQVSS